MIFFIVILAFPQSRRQIHLYIDGTDSRHLSLPFHSYLVNSFTYISHLYLIKVYVGVCVIVLLVLFGEYLEC